MKIRQILSCALAVILLSMLMIPALGAAFTDLEGHWAKSNMENLATRGYLNGFEDGTMRPEGQITGAETLALLSRFYLLNDDELERLYSDYSQKVQNVISSQYSWVYKNAAVCLAAGVLSEAELSVLSPVLPIKKEYLAVLLTRAMGYEILPAEVLTFSDTDQITIEYRPYIKHLANLGIVTGDDKNNFSPKSAVTRAVASAMFSRALDYLENSNKMPVIPDYMGLTEMKGIIDEMTSDSVSLMGFDGFLRIYPISASTPLTVEGETWTGFTYDGRSASVWLDKITGAVKKITVAASRDTVWVYGAFNRVTTTAGTRIVYLVDIRTGVTSNYTVASGISATVNGVATDFASLKTGDFIVMKLVNTRITEGYACSGDNELSGKVLSIKYDQTVTLLVESSGVVYKYYMTLASPPKVVRNNSEVRIDRIKADDNIKITVKSAVISLITVDGLEASVSGILSTISKSAGGTTLTITLDNGMTEVYPLENGAGIWSGKNELGINDLNIGIKVSLVVYAGFVTDVYIDETVSTMSKVSGIVLSVDLSKNQVILLSGEILTYVTFPTNASIFVVSSGNVIRLSNLPLNSLLTVYGSYLTSNQFAASSAIIE